MHDMWWLLKYIMHLKLMFFFICTYPLICCGFSVPTLEFHYSSCLTLHSCSRSCSQSIKFRRLQSPSLHLTTQRKYFTRVRITDILRAVTASQIRKKRFIEEQALPQKAQYERMWTGVSTGTIQVMPFSNNSTFALRRSFGVALRIRGDTGEGELLFGQPQFTERTYRLEWGGMSAWRYSELTESG